jgi:hypothetical protein
MMSGASGLFFKMEAYNLYRALPERSEIAVKFKRHQTIEIIGQVWIQVAI